MALAMWINWRHWYEELRAGEVDKRLGMRMRSVLW